MNLMEQVRAFDIPFEFLSDPINFFQNSPIRGDGTIGRGLSPALPGDKIVLHALMDMIVDMIVSGVNRTVRFGSK